MKTKNLFMTTILIIAFCAINQFANSQNTFCNCSGNKVGVYRGTGCTTTVPFYCGYQCACFTSKCIKSNQVNSYLSNRWHLCSSFPYRIAEADAINKALQIFVFPNPVTTIATISFFLEQSQKVSLKIFDMNGRLVATLADKVLNEGENEIVWNAKEVNAGIYFLQFQSAENLQTEKLIITK